MDRFVCFMCMGKLPINFINSEAAKYVARALTFGRSADLPARSTVVRRALKLFDAYVEQLKHTLTSASHIYATAIKPLLDAAAAVAAAAEASAETAAAPKQDNAKLDPFTWWSKQNMPIFQRCARRILCIPATSSDCERLFSLAGRVVRPERSLLSPANAEMFTLLASWLTTLPVPWSATVSSTGRRRAFSADALSMLPTAMTLAGVSGPPVVPPEDATTLEEEEDMPECAFARTTVVDDDDIDDDNTQQNAASHSRPAVSQAAVTTIQ